MCDEAELWGDVMVMVDESALIEPLSVGICGKPPPENHLSSKSSSIPFEEVRR